MSSSGENRSVRRTGEEGDPADVVVVVGEGAQPRVLVLHNLPNITCQGKKEEGARHAIRLNLIVCLTLSFSLRSYVPLREIIYMPIIPMKLFANCVCR